MSCLGRIKAGNEFSKVYQKGKSVADRMLVLYYLPNDFPYSRFGYAVGKKVGKAVVRNRYKRIVREIARINCLKIEKGFDFVAIVRPRSLEADFTKLEKSFLKLMKRVNVSRK